MLESRHRNFIPTYDANSAKLLANNNLFPSLAYCFYKSQDLETLSTGLRYSYFKKENYMLKTLSAKGISFLLLPLHHR